MTGGNMTGVEMTGEDMIRVRPLPPAADRTGLRRYGGPATDAQKYDAPDFDGLHHYWLAPNLFGADGAARRADPATIDAAVGAHLCRLRRPLGPRELRCLRAGLGLSQAGLGALLGYRDKQRVAAAEKRGGGRRPLAPTAELLLRSHYLAFTGAARLTGDEYRAAAAAIAAALTAPPAGLPGHTPATDYLVTW